MLAQGEANPLNVFGLRQLQHCPPHFERFRFDLRTDEKVITDWIYQNLTGRFYIGDEYHMDVESDQLVMSKTVAFERVYEVTYFALNLDQINSSWMDLSF